MKINSIYHSTSTRENNRQDRPNQYSKKDVHHPQILEREYVRALNSVKLDRMFAKPLVTSLDTFGEGIKEMRKDIHSKCFIVCSYDNIISLWNLEEKYKLYQIGCNEMVSGISIKDENEFYVGFNDRIEYRNRNNLKETYQCRYGVTGIDILEKENNEFEMGVATSCSVEFFDCKRRKAKYTVKGLYEKIRYNCSFEHVVGLYGNEKTSLYDIRAGQIIEEIKILNSTVMEFNPNKGFLVGIGTGDSNSYLYDMRKLEKPINVYRGHVGSVTSLAFNPQGTILSTGGHDKTIRIFEINERKSYDCYYNTRMHIIKGLVFSCDGRNIISGSDDGSLRLWKTKASRKQGPVSRQEKEAIFYREMLKKKYEGFPEIDRISRHRFLPDELKVKMRRENEKYLGSVRRKEKRIQRQKGEQNSI